MPQPANPVDAVRKIHADITKALAHAKVKSDAIANDDALAREKGSTPAHIEARKRVADLFCTQHFPRDTPAAIDARLAAIDFSQPVFPTDGRAASKPAGFFGLGRKPAFLVSDAFPPKAPTDPIYALQYIPIKR
jgi:hypothetical protein